MTVDAICLDDDEVRVFFAVPARLAADPTARDILSDVDRAHVARFVFERDRTVALASRALQRIALSHCAGIGPAAWRFEGDGFTKPTIASPTLAHPIEFSVANTVGLVACAVSMRRPVGIDVEPVRAGVLFDIVDRCWSERERRLLESAEPPETRLRRFAETWTAKEAYVKARGLGLSLNLADVDVDLDSNPPRLEVVEPSGRDGADWRLFSWFPINTHAAALCVHHEGREVSVTHRWIEQI